MPVMQNSLLHVFTEPLAIVAATGAVIESNTEARELLHRDSLHEFNALRGIVDDENALATCLEQSLNTDRFIPGELPIRMPDCAVIYVSVACSRLGYVPPR